ncbi:MAG: PHB depolymerase family esterase [Bdellovibrionia bacterium]
MGHFRNALALILAVSLLACASKQVPGPSEDVQDDGSSPYKTGLVKDQTTTVDGYTRKFHYYVPPGTTSSLPLVILLHGHGVNIDSMAGVSNVAAPYKVWMELAAQDKFIVVYPEGLQGSDGKLGWNDCRAENTENPNVDDVKFLNSLIASALYPADPQRVYVVGSSNGGMLALRMALESPNTVAAVGAVIANMPLNSECATPTEPTSILFMNGTSDSKVPYGGGLASGEASKGSVKSVADSIGFWKTLNATSATPSSTVGIADSHTGDSSTATLSTYLGGANNTSVYEYTITGGGHLEPSIKEQYSGLLELILGKQNHDLEMAEVIWAFLKGKTN